MKKYFKGFIIGVVISTLLISTALGTSVKKTIEVVYNSVNITVNGKKVNADNILYNGTTYVPLRAVSEALGKEVGWDQNTKTASINDKDTIINKPVQPQTSAINEYLVKDDTGKALYSFKINKVTNMNERNQYSDKNPAQVILIDYTYKNIANTEEVYLSEIYFKVVDSSGKIGYTYPNSVTNYPQSIPIGVTCDAQMIFALDNLSSNITLHYYENMFGSITKSFSIPIQ